MNEKVFREKSLDKVKSPESLNDYVRVSNPGIWLLLAAVLVLLIGACIWGVFGHIDTKVKASAVAENGTAFCTVSMEDGAKIKQGMTVDFGGKEGKVSKVTADRGKDTCTVSIETDVPDGIYAAEIVIASEKPISFVIN